MRTATQRVRRAAAIALALGAVACLTPGCHILAGFDDLEVRGGELGWNLRYGDGLDQEATAIAVDVAGNVVIAGTFNGTLDFGTGPLGAAEESRDVFVAKLAPSGQALWSRQITATEDAESVAGIAVDGEGAVFLVGQFREPLTIGPDTHTCPDNNSPRCSYVAKLDANGNHVWSHSLPVVPMGGAPTAELVVRAVAIHDQEGGGGSVVLAGKLRGMAGWGGGTEQGNGVVFVGKLGKDSGDTQWLRPFGAENTNQRADSVAVASASGRIIVAGQFTDQMAFGAETLQADSVNIFIASLSATGDSGSGWSKSIGNLRGVQHGPRVAAHRLGGVALTAYYQEPINLDGQELEGSGNHDLFIAKYTNSGELEWIKRGELANAPECTDVSCELPELSIAIDGNHEPTVAGSHPDTLEFDTTPLNGSDGEDAFVAKHNVSGDLMWALSFGAADGRAHAVVAVDPTDHFVYVTGFFERTIDLGNGALQSAGGKDIFLARFNP